jgi:hypothetical protein
LKASEGWKGVEKRDEPKDLSGCAGSVFVDFMRWNELRKALKGSVSLSKQVSDIPPHRLGDEDHSRR